MRKRILGKTGLQVSEIGVGCAVFGIENYLSAWEGSDEMDERAAATVDRAVALGCNYVDTAPSYGDCEERLGRILPAYRDRVYLATKISPADWSPDGVRMSVDRSLVRLKTDVIDVIQFHGGSLLHGEERQILESGVIDELKRLRDERKVRFIGFTAESPSGGTQRLLETAAFDTMQIQYSIMYQGAHDLEWNQGIMPMAEELGIGIITMRTMTSGRFHRLASLALPELSPDRANEIALQYVLSNPLVDVALIGMTNPEMVETNSQISEDTGGRIDLAAIHYPYSERR